jgi:peptidoglycan/LPS O-acetylase OafA/YrhL
VSYSIYLGHIMVITWAGRALQAWAYGPAILSRPLLLYGLYSVLILLLASLTYYAWERPFLSLRDA